MPEIVDHTESIFAAVVALTAPEERAAYLDRACAGDPALRDRLESLLRAHHRAGHLLDRPAPDGPDRTGLHVPATAIGAVIAGRYKLLEEIGEGGMGTVFVAEQTQPVRRKVAVKLIKPGMDSKSVLARFEAERQALAMMDHPNIAKVLDGGLTEAGRPFFVMEYVKGVPITEYCDATRLSVTERLELFVQVCQAVQHAHQKGIIHRDLKPSNILVAPYDGTPVPKVIDFGLAKAMHHSLTERTLHTAHETVLGTPRYMSPEQAQLNNLDVDTRSDIYSLGVLLYELLTGTTPLDAQRYKEAAWDEVRRIIREEEPPRPSTRLSSANTLPSLAACRHMEPAGLTKLVRGELDWIVMKSLEKDRNRRYETATGFAADVLRYLSGEAVQAHPPSTAYRVKKFVRRHKGQVIAASLVLFALLAGMAGTSLGLVEAKRQEAEARRQEGIARGEATAKEQARAAEADQRAKAVAATEEERTAKEAAVTAAAAEKAAKEQAQKNLAFAKKGNELLGSVFAGLDPKRNYANVGEFSEALKANLKKAVLDLEGSAIGDPLEVAEMQNTLGISLLGLGDPGQAIILFEKARATWTAKLGSDHPDTLASMNNLALGYLSAGKLDLALPLLEETLKLKKAKQGTDHSDTLASMNNLATGYLSAGKLDLALPLLEETQKLRKAKHGADHPDTLMSMHNLAAGYRVAGKLDLALPLSEETLKLRKAKLGADHPDTLMSMNNLAAGYRVAGKLDLALPLYQEAVAGMKKHRFQQLNAGGYVNDLIACHEQLNQLDHAETWRRKWLAVVKERTGVDSVPYAGELAALGLNLLRQKKWADAEGVLRESLALCEKKQPDAWNTFNTQSMLGGALLGQKKYADAEPLLAKGYEGMKQREKSIPPGGKVRLREALERLVQLYDALGKKDEAAKWRKELESLGKTAGKKAGK